MKPVFLSVRGSDYHAAHDPVGHSRIVPFTKIGVHWAFSEPSYSEWSENLPYLLSGSDASMSDKVCDPVTGFFPLGISIIYLDSDLSRSADVMLVPV